MDRLIRRPAAYHLVSATFFVALFLLLSYAASAQTTTTTRATDGHTPLEIAPGSPAGSYALSGFDNISLFSQSIGFRLPLLRVGGRGEASYTMTLPIERKWRVTHTVYDPSAGCSGCEQSIPEHHYVPESNWYTALKPGFSPGVMIVRMSGMDLTKFGGTCGTIYLKALARLTFVGPDGTEYELRDARYNGEPMTPGCTEGANRGKVFVTSDGSSATFVADADIKDFPRPGPGEDAVIPVSGYLYLRDGTRYHIKDNAVDVIRDRNGNELRFYDSVEVQPGVFGQKAVDSVGREVYITAPNTSTTLIAYKGFGGAQRALTILYAPLSARLRQANAEHPAETIKQRAELFPGIPYHPQDIGVTGADFDDVVVSEVVLPDGRKYGFRYNSYGELARVELPTGGAFEYDYQAEPGVISTGNDYEIFRRVVQKRVYREGDQLEGVTTFSGCAPLPTGSINSCVQADQLDPNAEASSCAQPLADTGYRLISRTRHYFNGTPGPGLFTQPTHYTKWDEGKEFRTESYACDGTTLLRSVNQEWRQKGQVGWWVTYDLTRGPEPSNDPRMVETVTTLADSGQVSKISSIRPSDGSVRFDQYNNQTDVWEYDYGAGVPLRHTKTDYLTVNSVNGVDYTGGASPTPDGVYLRGLPLQKSVYEVHANFSEVERARVMYEYDNYAPDAGSKHAALMGRSDIFGLCLDKINDSCQTLSTASYQTRGNVTAMTNYLLDNNGGVTGTVASYAQYDVAGNAVKAIDAFRHEMSFDFADNFGAPDGGEARTNTPPAELAQQSPQAHAYAFPKSVTDAAGYASYTQYDYYLGRPVDGEDINGAHTLLYYNDPLDRLKSGIQAFGSTAEQSQTTINYNDSAHTITVTSDLNSYNDNVLKTEKIYDGFGRTVQTRKYEGTAQYILSEQKYDALGRVYKVSNPYRPALGENPVWTTTTYDAMGRVTLATTPDGATAYTLYDGSRTLVTDQAKRQRISKSDALGRLTEVWEVRTEDAASGTEHVTFPVPQGGPVPDISDGYRTAYSYDVLGNVRTVTQGVQTRSFVYDSLSRLTSATNPEACRQGQAGCVPALVTYNYDANGNLVLKTDPRDKIGNLTLPNCSTPYLGAQVATCYEYDSLNRLKSRSYNDGTPDVTYTYDDPAAVNSKGRLTSVGSSVSTYNYGAFDVLGRVKSSSQTTDGITYSMPEYKYDLAGNLTSEKYPSGRVVETKYDATGRVAGVSNPTTGLYYAGGASTDLENRIQYTAAGAPSSVRLGNGLWEHTLYNSRFQQTQVGLGTSVADSSVLKLNYTYGEIVSGALDATKNNGNLQGQTITASSGVTFNQSYTYDGVNRIKTAQEAGQQGWTQNFSYDRYGNRNFGAGTTFPNYSQATLDPTTNLPIDPLVNPVIDTANNRIKTFIAGQGNYLYDAAGNMTRVPVTSQTYHDFVYDAENRQVKADGGAAAGGSDYSYDGDGKRVQKLSGAVKTVFVYDVAGKLVAEYSNVAPAVNGTRYVTSDMLGTPRVITGSDGQAKERHDYMPFGEEITLAYNGRGNIQGYGANHLSQKLTGKERDAETGLDFFGARYYASAYGRFTSVDMAAPDVVNPQTMNKYKYCLNNPLKFTDQNGLYEEDVHRDLTNALAYAAGFSESESATIAAANQEVDDNPETDPVTVFPIEERIKVRALFHFTSPGRRARLWGEFKLFATASEYGEPRDRALNALGIYFHAQQDSFSHPRELYGPILGHARDGHEPDKTYNDPLKAFLMALDTYNRLVNASSFMGGTSQPVPFNGFIANKVFAFSMARTPAEKSKYIRQIIWFVKWFRRLQERPIPQQEGKIVTVLMTVK